MLSFPLKEIVTSGDASSFSIAKRWFSGAVSSIHSLQECMTAAQINGMFLKGCSENQAALCVSA